MELSNIGMGEDGHSTRKVAGRFRSHFSIFGICCAFKQSKARRSKVMSDLTGWGAFY